MSSYPHLVLKNLKEVYPYAAINTIITAIGGENSVDGEKRFKDDVLNHKPDILIILLTPSPDSRVDYANPQNELFQHSNQIRELAKKYGTGLVDSYKAFEFLYNDLDALKIYMAHVNHPNTKGHELITNEIMKYFK